MTAGHAKVEGEGREGLSPTEGTLGKGGELQTGKMTLPTEEHMDWLSGAEQSVLKL